MKLRTLVLASAAAAALACTGGAIAQDSNQQNSQYSSQDYSSQDYSSQTTQQSGTSEDRDTHGYSWPNYPQNPYHTNPTPEERSQTSALNRRQGEDEGTAQNGQTGRSADSQYQAEQQRYQEQRQKYEDQQENYQHRLAQYEFDRRHPRWWWRAHYFDASVSAFYRLPTHDLIGREVAERDGLTIGHISDIERYPGGHVERIEVTLPSDRVAWIDAANLRYDAADGIMFTDVPADELYDRSRGDYYDPRP